MAFDGTFPDLLEATKDALKELLGDNLTTLNTALSRDDLWDGLIDITEAMIVIGDPESAPKSKTIAPLWITIFGGEESLRGDQVNLEITGGYGYENRIELTLRVYLHPECFPSANPFLQAQKRERAVDRVCGWLRAGVCNTHSNKTLLLASDEYDTGADELNETHITRISRGEFWKNFGGMKLIQGAEITWVGSIE